MEAYESHRGPYKKYQHLTFVLTPPEKKLVCYIGARELEVASLPRDKIAQHFCKGIHGPIVSIGIQLEPGTQLRTRQLSVLVQRLCNAHQRFTVLRQQGLSPQILFLQQGFHGQVRRCHVRVDIVGLIGRAISATQSVGKAAIPNIFRQGLGCMLEVTDRTGGHMVLPKHQQFRRPTSEFHTNCIQHIARGICLAFHKSVVPTRVGRRVDLDFHGCS